MLDRTLLHRGDRSENTVASKQYAPILRDVNARRTFRPDVQLRHHIFLLSHMLEGISVTITAVQFISLYIFNWFQPKKRWRTTLRCHCLSGFHEESWAQEFLNWHQHSSWTHQPCLFIMLDREELCPSQWRHVRPNCVASRLHMQMFSSCRPPVNPAALNSSRTSWFFKRHLHCRAKHAKTNSLTFCRPPCGYDLIRWVCNSLFSPCRMSRFLWEWATDVTSAAALLTSRCVRRLQLFPHKHGQGEWA